MTEAENKKQDIRITICACASRAFIDKEAIAEIAAAMKNGGYSVSIEGDLCRKVAESPAEVQDIAAGVVMACHTRAVLSHIDWMGLKAGRIEDIRGSNASEVLSRFGLSYSEAKDAAQKDIFRKQIEAFPVESGTDSWYPIIDKTRCIECGKCHDFCLFGVYAVTNRQVRVAQPKNCKNNCPACARMCPHQAIIFPKYEKSPINGGTAQEETFNPEEKDLMYRERLQARLRQRRAGISLLKNDDK